MDFVGQIKAACAALKDLQRMSVRALGRQLDLSGEDLEELVEELVDIQQVARREGEALIWLGSASAAPTPPPGLAAPVAMPK